MTPPAQEDREQTESERVVIRDNRKIDRQQEAATEPPPAAEPEPEIDENMKLLEERTADLQRLQAEYANYRKRSERDRLLAGDLATGRVLTELLPVLDDFDRARAHGDLEGGPLKAVADKLDAAFTKLGLAKFGEAGDAFDPSVHEAVLHDESDEVTVPTATTIMRPGYRHHDRLLRPAMVGVSDPAVAIGQPVDEPAEEPAGDE